MGAAISVYIKGDNSSLERWARWNVFREEMTAVFWTDEVAAR